jgi:hypothetical protein
MEVTNIGWIGSNHRQEHLSGRAQTRLVQLSILAGDPG